MNTRKVVLLPKIQALLDNLGENMKMARLRRKFSTQLVSERAGIARTTLWNIEKGPPQVAIGAYCQVLFVLGLAEDLLKIATDDELGRRLAAFTSPAKSLNNPLYTSEMHYKL